MNTHDIGDLVQVDATEITVAGVPTDPTTLSLTVTDPTGSATVYIYGTDAELVKDSVGNYHADLLPTLAGRWAYLWGGTGAATFGEEGAFYVRTRPALCSVADIEDFLQLTVPAAGLGAANRAIREATAAIQNYCKQTIARVAGDEITLDVDGSRTKLFLPELPVISIASVVEDGETLTVTDDYKLGQYGILHRIGAYWTSGIQTVTITYTHGYATIPEDVVSICTRAAARSYQSGLRAAALQGVAGVQAQTLGDYSVQYGSEQAGGSGDGGTLGASAAPILLPSERKILDAYRVKRP